MSRFFRLYAPLALVTIAAPVALLAQTITFATPKQFTVTLPDSASVARYSAADFNADGKMDYLLEPWNQNDLLDYALLMGNGSGSFTTVEANVPVPFSLEYIVADVNNDGKADIITLEPGCQKGDTCSQFAPGPNSPNNATGSFKVYLNEGSGRFTNTFTGTLPQLGTLNFVAGDFNGDGKPDVAVLASSFNSNTIPGTPPQLIVFLNQGSGLFTQHTDTNLPSSMTTQTTNIGNLVTGNFIGTGHKDLLFSFEAGSGDPAPKAQIFILPNDGSGTFGKPKWAFDMTTTAPADFIFADLNGDKLTDLLYLDGSIRDAVVLMAKSGGGFTQHNTVHYFIDFPSQWAFSDVNGDSKWDLAIDGANSGSTAGTAAIFPGFGNGTFNQSYKALHPTSNAGQMAIAPLMKGRLPSVMFQTSSDGFELYVNTTE
ncbi:MAG TPA: VCBS repeat-containing protein [Silvibacterium sp.]|nr:VCBS repeat-containing protein [Silvibacterium sp.]